MRFQWQRLGLARVKSESGSGGEVLGALERPDGCILPWADDGTLRFWDV